MATAPTAVKDAAKPARPATDPAGPTGRLATWVAETTLDDVPSSVRDRAKHLILDGIACALVGAQLRVSRIGVKGVTALDSAGDAALVGWGGRATSATSAAAMLRRHKEAQELERMLARGTWQDSDYVFTDPRRPGQPWNPDQVTKRFKKLRTTAGVPVIKYHEGGRHTAIGLNHDAEVREDVSMREAGHSDRATHVIGGRSSRLAPGCAGVPVCRGRSWSRRTAFQLR